MSKRLITPIIIEGNKITIQNFSDLSRCIGSSPILYSLIYESGDAHRMSHAYGEHTSAPRLSSGAVPKDMSPLSKEGAHILSGNIYNIDEENITMDISLMGYHRQKTAMIFANTTIISSEIVISFATIMKGEIRVVSGGSLILCGCFVDSCRIICERGGRIVFSDVELSGAIHEAIKIEEGGHVEQWDNVRFYDCHKKLYIERASKEHTSLVLDISSPVSVLDFMEDSIILSIELDSDFIITSKREFTLKQPLSFIGISDETISVSLGQINTSSNIIIEGNVDVYVDISIAETENISLSLANFFGTVTFKDVGDANFSETAFISKSIISLDSQISIKNCIIVADNFYTGENSVLTIESSKINNCSNVFSFNNQRKPAKDEELLGNETDVNKITFNESSIARCHNLVFGTIENVDLINSNFTDSTSLFNLVQCSANVSNVTVSNVDCFMTLNRGSLTGDHLHFNGGASHIKAGGQSKILLQRSSFSNSSDFSLEVFNSTIETHFCEFSNGFNAVRLHQDSSFMHNTCIFENFTGSTIAGDYDRKIIDLSETKNDE